MILWQEVNFAYKFQTDRMKHNTINPGFVLSIVSICPGIMPQWVQKMFFHGTNFLS